MIWAIFLIADDILVIVRWHPFSYCEFALLIVKSQAIGESRKVHDQKDMSPKTSSKVSLDDVAYFRGKEILYKIQPASLY